MCGEGKISVALWWKIALWRWLLMARAQVLRLHVGTHGLRIHQVC